MRACLLLVLGFSPIALFGQNTARAAYIKNLIDQSVNPGELPAGYGSIMVGYLDQFGTVYKGYGQPTVDGTVALNEKTVFGIGSLTKLFAATLLGVANTKGLDLATPVLSLLPSGVTIPASANCYDITLLETADHHAGLPKNEGHLYNSLSDLYNDYAADPITCTPSTQELIHDCGCCDPAYMGLLGLQPTCGTGVANPVYSCPTHPPTKGPAGWVYSNLGFEVMGNAVAAWLGYPDWNTANLKEITQPLGMPDTIPLESFTPSQVSRAAKHCDPKTRATNANCQLLDWLPVGNPGGGLFSTASDLLKFVAYNAYGATDPAAASLAAALPVIHKRYESYPQCGQELGWQSTTLVTGEVEHWKDGSDGPFNTWVGYMAGPLTRMVVLLDTSGSLNVDLGKMGSSILIGAGPSISSVATANGPAEVAQNTWVAIKGSNLVPSNAAAPGVDWSSAPEFASGQMPTQIGNVSVTVDGKPAFVDFYCSAVTSSICASDQINILTPLDSATGPVKVVVTNQGVSSAPFTVNMQAAEPAFLRFDATHVVATHLDGSLLGPGYSTPAKPGESIVAYAVGFGLPSAGVTNGSSTQSGALSPVPQCQIGGSAAAVAFAGLISPGLFQFNLTVPATVTGNATLVCTSNGVSTPQGAVIVVQ